MRNSQIARPSVAVLLEFTLSCGGGYFPYVCSGVHCYKYLLNISIYTPEGHTQVMISELQYAENWHSNKAREKNYFLIWTFLLTDFLTVRLDATTKFFFVKRFFAVLPADAG